MYQPIRNLPKLALNLICIASVCTTSIGTVSRSQASTVKSVDRETAINNTTDVPLWSGRSTFIDFSRTNEAIVYILLADPSKTTFSTDAPLASRQAKTIFLRQIKPLQFRGATTAPITNLSIKTQSPDGKQRIYTFNIIPKQGLVTTNGVAVVPFVPVVEPRILQLQNQTATASDIELGLAIAINRKYTLPNDPVVFKVRNFIGLAKNSVPIATAASRANVSMDVITKLAQLGIQEKTLRQQVSR